MAILTALPHLSIINGFRGVIDFYLWKGIPCARRWPRWKKRKPYPAEAANQQAFAYANKLWPTLPPYIRTQYITMAVGTPLRGQDIFVRAYMRGITY